MDPAMTVVDVDSHVYEPAAIWEDYLGRDERPLARAAFWHEIDAGGLETTILNGRPVRALERSGIPRRACWRPGMTPQSIGALDPEAPHAVSPGAVDPAARLRDMDAMGIDRALLFPTLFAEHFPLIENPDAARVLARAYNDWLLDFATASARRLLPVAILPLQSVSFAVTELERVAERGCKAAFIRPSFFQGRFPSHPSYKPLWKRLEELGVAGAAWVPLALEKAETYLWLFSGIRDVSLEPERVFFARPSLVAFDSWEHAVGRMPDVFERVAAWGSRYPNHDTGTVEEARAMLGRHGVAAETVGSFLGGNAIRHFGLG
ncbi:MAG: hypothetical protein E6J83_17140 [Deltaproteobacteria bacterium]|nr:MAG: hypothetical protein E6J83_17140 [Deltaproteobacteria bacterium]